MLNIELSRDHFLKELLKGEFLFNAWHCYDWLLTTRQNFYFLDLHNSFIMIFVFHFAILMIIICDHNGVIFFILISK